jgi:hypothetical protein
MTAYPWREEWQKAFCIEERRRMVDMDGWFGVTVVLRKNGSFHHYGVFYGKKDLARAVYFAMQNVVMMDRLDACYVYADACSVEDKAPCLMDSFTSYKMTDEE